MWGPRLPNLRRTELTLQILHPFRSWLPRMPWLMILGFENLVIKACLPCGALVSIILIFIEHPAQILGITILILIMMIVLTSTWRITKNFCLHLRILRELTLPLILALLVNRKRALNYLSTASIVRHIITVYISHFYYDSHVRLCLNLFFFCCIFLSWLEVLVFVPLLISFIICSKWQVWVLTNPSPQSGMLVYIYI